MRKKGTMTKEITSLTRCLIGKDIFINGWLKMSKFRVKTLVSMKFWLKKTGKNVLSKEVLLSSILSNIGLPTLTVIFEAQRIFSGITFRATIDC